MCMLVYWLKISLTPCVAAFTITQVAEHIISLLDPQSELSNVSPHQHEATQGCPQVDLQMICNLGHLQTWYVGLWR